MLILSSTTDSTEKDIAILIPDNTSLFVDMSSERQATSTGARIISLLPPACEVESHGSLFVDELRTLPYARATIIRSSLELALLKTIWDIDSHNIEPNPPAVEIADLGVPGRVRDRPSLLKWTSTSPIAVNVRPADSRNLFRPDRTYWLVGLTGGLGLSLCEWMVQHGAQYVVISSRNPKIEGQWLQNMEDADAVVRICSW